MRIEEYGINADVTFHDIRKQGYETPVSYSFLLKAFDEKISHFPLVRSQFAFSRLNEFTVTFSIGFKNGIFYSSAPIANYAQYRNPQRTQPYFDFQSNTKAPLHGAIAFSNKSEYIIFLKAISRFVIEASVLV